NPQSQMRLAALRFSENNARTIPADPPSREFRVQSAHLGVANSGALTVPPDDTATRNPETRRPPHPCQRRIVC
ncbi:MAG TPA: hypothetical protein VGU44_05775, partial [Gammaproteobacteria bacterium]|nr:hypothetical protein [Gammaproteobacteria bacterium]